jgi:hypothetical protein
MLQVNKKGIKAGVLGQLHNQRVRYQPNTQSLLSYQSHTYKSDSNHVGIRDVFWSSGNYDGHTLHNRPADALVSSTLLKEAILEE